MEICITSNTFTKKIVQKASEHPIRAFFDKGVFVTVNTDDPVFFKTDLLNEYWICHNELGFSLDEIKQLIINSFNASFISDAEKQDFIKQVNSAY